MENLRGHSSAFIAATFALVARGYTVEIKGTGRASYQAKIRDQLDLLVGDLEYRDPADEPNPQAQGLSFASYCPTLGVVFELINGFI